MTTENDLAQRLQSMLDNAGLVFDDRPAKIFATELVLSRPHLVSHYLSVMGPEEDRKDVLVVVRQVKASASRFLQYRPHTDQKDFEVNVLLLVPFYPFDQASRHSVLREQVVGKVVDFFTNNPQFGVYKTVFTDDHLSGRSYVLSTLITVTKTYRR